MRGSPSSRSIGSRPATSPSADNPTADIRAHGRAGAVCGIKGMRVEFLVPAGEITDKLLADALSLVGAVIPAVRSLTKYERILAYDWAMREHLRASDNLCRARPRPSFIQEG